LLYTLLYMAPATRTQVYLTTEQRERIDALRASDGRSLAEVVRDALDSYLDRERPDAARAFGDTFGAAPDLAVPSRDEWAFRG
jgi:Arc/MetJ-type ribon-helix-helix transcriptional regulator